MADIFFLDIKMYPGPFCEKNSFSKDQVLHNFDSLVPFPGGTLMFSHIHRLRLFFGV